MASLAEGSDLAVARTLPVGTASASSVGAASTTGVALVDIVEAGTTTARNNSVTRRRAVSAV